MDIQYDGYMDDYLSRILLVGQENGVITGHMETCLFEDMDIWKYGLLSHMMMMPSYFMMIGCGSRCR